MYKIDDRDRTRLQIELGRIEALVDLIKDQARHNLERSEQAYKLIHEMRKEITEVGECK